MAAQRRTGSGRRSRVNVTSAALPEWLSPESGSPCRRAYLEIARHVRSQRLRPGDLLPTHREWCERLGVSSDTVAVVMRRLVERGVVARKTRVGTVLLDPAAWDEVPRVVGVATFAAPQNGPTAFFAELAHRLHEAMVRQGWRSRSYYCLQPDEPVSLSQFANLRPDLAEGRLDALVLLTPLVQAQWQALEDDGVACVHLPFWEEAPSAVLLDEGAAMRDALAYLLNAKCRRVLVVRHRPTDVRRCAAGRAARALLQGRRLPPRTVSFHQVSGFPTIDKGRAVGAALLGAADAMPDGLIIFDDYLAIGVAQVLASLPAERRPRLVAYANRQVPTPLAVPALRMTVDLDQYVARATTLLRERLEGRTRAGRIELVRAESDASELTAFGLRSDAVS